MSQQNNLSHYWHFNYAQNFRQKEQTCWHFRYKWAGKGVCLLFTSESCAELQLSILKDQAYYLMKQSKIHFINLYQSRSSLQPPCLGTNPTHQRPHSNCGQTTLERQTQGTPLEHLALVTRRYSANGPHRTHSI